MNPKVSVIIPTYNRPHLIKRAIKSVLNQTYQHFEIIVVDDSDNDETKKVIEGFGDKRIKYIKNEIRTTHTAARNLAIKNSDSQSKYIAFLDDDDEWLPQFLEKCVNKLEERTDLVGVIPVNQHVYEIDGWEIRIPKKTNPVKEIWNTGIGNGSVLRRDLFFKENIWFDEKISKGEDLDLGIRILKDHKIASIEEPLQIYHHYLAPEGKKLSTLFLSPETYDYFYQKHIDYYKNLGIEPLAFFYLYIGRRYCRSGEVKKGKQFFLKAFKLNYKPIYLIYYLFWSFPKFAQSFTKEDLIFKILRIYKGIIEVFRK
jgi:glycosyltransferase involved in cell wall biosynthesis